MQTASLLHRFADYGLLTTYRQRPGPVPHPSTMHRDPDLSKGAVESDRRDQPTNTSLSGQLPHRTGNPLVKSSDSDFPEPGNNEEHTGEPSAADRNLPQDKERNNPRVPNRENPEAQLNDQDPGHRQKQNQGQKKDDDLAA